MKHGCVLLLILMLSGCSSLTPAQQYKIITAADQLATCIGSLTMYQLNQFEQQDAANTTDKE